MRHVVPLLVVLVTPGCYATHSRATPDAALDAPSVPRDGGTDAPSCSVALPLGGRDIARRGARLYVVEDGAIEVFDLSSPMTPRPVERFADPRLDEPSSAVMADDLVVATYGGALVAFSVMPSLAARETLSVTGVHPRQLAGSGSALFVGSDTPQLEVFAARPLTTVGVETLPQPTFGLLADYGYVFGGGPDFVVWDLRDGRTFPMRELSRCARCAENAWRVQALLPNVLVAGGYRLRSFDVTVPETPRLTRSFESPTDRVYDAAPFADGTVAIANDHFGFRLLRPNDAAGFDVVAEGATGRWTIRVMNWDERHLVVLDEAATTIVDLDCLRGGR